MTKPPLNVALFVTCLVDLFRPSVGFAAVKLLRAAGCTISVPDQTSLAIVLRRCWITLSPLQHYSTLRTGLIGPVRSIAQSWPGPTKVG